MKIDGVDIDELYAKWIRDKNPMSRVEAESYTTRPSSSVEEAGADEFEKKQIQR